MPSPILNSTPSAGDRSTVLVVWDVQTGVVINDIVVEIPYPYGINFCGNQTIVLISKRSITLRTYDVLNGTQLFEGILPLHNLLTHWVRGESFLFATSFEIGGKSAIDIRELQPSSNSPFLVVESFLVPYHDMIASFSPVSFHLSFFIDGDIFVLDVRDSKILLQTDMAVEQRHPRSECFSPDGRFFACVAWDNEIRVWKSTSTGYVPWSTPVPRFPPRGTGGFVFSPTATTILCWGDGGIVLLDNHLRPPPPNETGPPRSYADHLVAYSADGAHIATARRGHDVVTILGPLLDTPKQYINTDMRIQDIKILGNSVFVADKHGLVSWDLGGGAQGVRRATFDGILLAGIELGNAERFALSNNCTLIAINAGKTVFLYDVMAQEILNEYEVDIGYSCNTPPNIQFSPDGCHLWLAFVSIYDDLDNIVYEECGKLDVADDWSSVDLEIWPIPGDGRSWDGYFPPGYHIQIRSEWVVDPRGRKLLWLPPDQRTGLMTDARWDGDFLAFVRVRRPGPPLIIKFQP